MLTLRQGAQGAQVDLLQWGLNRAGLLKEPADGIFGAKTEQSVRELQKNFNLEPDGVVGAQSWAALYPHLTGLQTHLVQPGDTIWVIAARYRSTVAAVLTANPGIRPENLQSGMVLKIPLPFPVVPSSIRWCSDLLALTVDGLRARYPFLQVETIGKSVLGRPLYLLRLGVGKVRVGYNAAHHANEWITTPLLLKFVENYAENYAEGDTIGGVDYRYLYNAYTLEVVPMVDPDGVDLVTGALPPDSPALSAAQAIAAAFPAVPFPDGWKANIKGIDLNLSYPANWEKAKAVKYAQGYTRPAPRDFVGPAPLAAPESAAMARQAKRANYALTLSLHSQGKLIFWKYADRAPAGAYELAKKMQGVSGYLPAVTPPGSDNAGYKDWFIQEYNRPGYTIEVGQGQNPLPLSQFDIIYRACFGILMLGMAGMDD
ncbi:MAG: peptidoglycan-binding protein [Oscillospiraceae bacterium]|nr:peptidoglycan-binding protein [Oscillospiraceae bacterium]